MIRVQPARDVAQPARSSRTRIPPPAPVPTLSPNPYIVSSTTTRYRLPVAYDGLRTARDTTSVRGNVSPSRPLPSARTQQTSAVARAHSSTSRVHSPASISQLRDTLANLDFKVAALLSERARLEASLEQAVHLHSPIQRLPSELLSTIFTIGASGPKGDEPLVLSNLMLVCRHWAALVRDTAALWSRITISPHHPLSRARTRLARSKSVPLDVSIVLDARREFLGVHFSKDEVIGRALDILIPHMWRWRSFHLAVPESSQAHAALARCIFPAPLLESLHIRVANTLQEEEVDPPSPHPLFTGLVPLLRECRLHSLPVDWDARSMRLSGLRVLDLGGYWTGVPPSVYSILDILRASPALEELALSKMYDIEPDAGDLFAHEAYCGGPIPLRVITLPRLRKATFSYAGIERTRAVLSQLVFPALEELSLCYLDNVTPVLPHIGRQALKSLPLRCLRIEQSICSEGDLLKFLGRVPSLTSMELIDVEGISSSFLQNLATPIGQSWICPNLTTFTLDGCTTFSFSALRTFVERRLSPHTRAYPRSVPPRSLVSSPPSTYAVYLSSDRESMRPSRSSRPAPVLCRSQSTPPHDAVEAFAWPCRLRRLSLARCPQFSREMLQWLRMYVPEVKQDAVRESAFS